MSVKIKAFLYGIISLVGNGAILLVLPEEWRPYLLVGFNLVQVAYAFFDPSYTIHQIQIGKRDALGNRK